MDLVNHLWQSTVVGLAILILLTVCGQLPARIRRTLAGMALAKFAVPASCFMWLIRGAGVAPQRWLASHPLTVPVNLPAEIFTPVALVSPVPDYRLAGLLVVAGWLAGCGLLFAFWLLQSWRARRELLAKAAPVSAAMERRIEAAAWRVGLRKSPDSRAVESDHGPGVLGIISPLMIIPRGLEDTLAPAELESVLIHECVHLQRRDNVWSALQFLVVSLLWFNPVVWLLHRRLGVETEKSCDERVLEITGDPDSYASGIIGSVRHTLGLIQPGWAGTTTPPVAARIKNIFACGSRPRRPLAHGAALTAGVLLLALSVPASVTAVSSEVSNSPAAPGDAKKAGGAVMAEVRVVHADSKYTTTIGLSQEGAVSFNGRPVTLDGFIVAIQEVGKKDKDSSLLIRVDARTPYGQLFWVLDECRKVGLIKIDFQAPSAGGLGRK